MADLPGQIGTPISRLPYGLLDLFGVKTQGSYPLYIRNDYQPTIEIVELLAASHGELLTDQTISLAALNFTASTLVVPQTEVWYVSTVSAFLITAAGQAIIATAWALSPDQYNNALGPTITIAASQQRHSAMSQLGGPGVYLPPGTQIGFHVDSLTAGPVVNNQLLIRIRRLRV